MIIGFTGKKQVGKTTAATYLARNMDGGNMIYSLALPIKEIANVLFEWDEYAMQELKEVKCPVAGITPREFLQWLGTDVMRVAFNERFPYSHIKNVWIHKLRNQLRIDYYKNIFIDDVRFQDEADEIIKAGGVIIKINRRTDSDDNHPSENQSINGIKYTINNNSSPEALYANLDRIIGSVGV